MTTPTRCQQAIDRMVAAQNCLPYAARERINLYCNRRFRVEIEQINAEQLATVVKMIDAGELTIDASRERESYGGIDG